MPRGTLFDEGHVYGLVYMGNEQSSRGAPSHVLPRGQLARSSAAWRSTAPAGSSPARRTTTAPTVRFVSDAFDSLASFGTAGLVQNTWRELAPMSGPLPAASRTGASTRTRATADVGRWRGPRGLSIGTMNGR